MTKVFPENTPKPSLHNGDQFVDPVEKHLYEQLKYKRGYPG